MNTFLSLRCKGIKMPELSKEEIIAAMKEAGKEYLKEVMAQFGLLTLKTASALIVVMLFYAVMHFYGWRRDFPLP